MIFKNFIFYFVLFARLMAQENNSSVFTKDELTTWTKQYPCEEAVIYAFIDFAQSIEPSIFSAFDSQEDKATLEQLFSTAQKFHCFIELTSHKNENRIYEYRALSLCAHLDLTLLRLFAQPETENYDYILKHLLYFQDHQSDYNFLENDRQDLLKLIHHTQSARSTVMLCQNKKIPRILSYQPPVNLLDREHSTKTFEEHAQDLPSPLPQEHVQDSHLPLPQEHVQDSHLPLPQKNTHLPVCKKKMKSPPQKIDRDDALLDQIFQEAEKRRIEKALETMHVPLLRQHPIDLTQINHQIRKMELMRVLQNIQKEFNDAFFEKLKDQNDDFRRHAPDRVSNIIRFYGKDAQLDIFYERLKFFFDNHLSELVEIYFLIHYNHIVSIIDEAYCEKKEVNYDKISFLFFIGVCFQKIGFSFEAYQNQLADFSTVTMMDNHLAILEYLLSCRLSLRLSQNASSAPEALSDCYRLEDFCFTIFNEHLDHFLSISVDRKKVIESLLSIILKLSFTHNVVPFLNRIPSVWMSIDHPTIQAFFQEIDLFIEEEKIKKRLIQIYLVNRNAERHVKKHPQHT